MRGDQPVLGARNEGEEQRDRHEPVEEHELAPRERGGEPLVDEHVRRVEHSAARTERRPEELAEPEALRQGRKSSTSPPNAIATAANVRARAFSRSTSGAASATKIGVR